MELYGKALIYVVFILIGLYITQTYLFKKPSYSPIESFNNINVTYIQKIAPQEGDSSTIVKLNGKNFNFISKIYLFLDNNYAQCVILQSRTNDTIEFIPPPITELGKTLNDIRNNIIEKKSGLKTNLVFVRGEKDGDEFVDKALNLDDDNVVKVDNLNFYYIDRLPYKNNCEVPAVQPAPSEPEVIPELNLGNTDFVYEKNSDLEFLNKILPEKQDKIDKLYKSIADTLEKYANLQSRDLETLKKLQALESVKDIKRQYNIERYNINYYLKNHFT